MPNLKRPLQALRHSSTSCQGDADAAGHVQRRAVSVASHVGAALALTALGAVGAVAAQASPLLRCEFEHGGQRQVKDFAPVSEPYGVRAVAFDDDFRFKAVLAGDAQRVQYVSLYTYHVQRGEAVLLHQAKYLAPVVAPAYMPGSLTGMQTVHEPRIGLPLHYHCGLFEAAP